MDGRKRKVFVRPSASSKENHTDGCMLASNRYIAEDGGTYEEEPTVSIIWEPEPSAILTETAEEKRMNDGSYSLPFFDSRFHILEESSKAETGFLAKMFGFSAEESYASVVHEVCQYDKVINKEGKKVKWGVALRLIAISRTTGLDFDISIPNFAAAGQLGHLDTSAMISVIGVNHIPGNVAPVPEKLDVDTFVELNASFEKLQSIIFGEKFRDKYDPRQIEYEDD